MASVFLTSTVPDARGGSFRKLQALAGSDRFGVHGLVDDPASADLILLAETAWGNELMWKARRHPLVRRHREKVFVQCELDGVVPYLPGVYTSVPRRLYRADRVRTGSYLVMYHNPAVTYEVAGPEPEWLFSFVGDSRTHPLRRRVLALSHPRGLLDDTAGRSSAREQGPEAKAAFQRAYADTLRASSFVLCPSGVSPSTVRLFEVMRVGRVPVVISDEWVPPEGPAWDSFSVRVREADVDTIPDLLSRRESEAAQMGQRARRAWEEWFADDVAFHRTVEWCLDIAQARTRPESVLRWTALRAFGGRGYFLNGVRQTRDGVQKWIRSRSRP